MILKNTEVIYNDLINLWSIGDKLACFIIRDIGLMNPGGVGNDYKNAFRLIHGYLN